jgi:hypothetical protein
MAKIGATNADMAAALDISLATFTVWCSQFPELREAVHTAKELFDTRVERALAERALGYFAREGWLDVTFGKQAHGQDQTRTTSVHWLKGSSVHFEGTSIGNPELAVTGHPST